jgi:hypothetical protein
VEVTIRYFERADRSVHIFEMEGLEEVLLALSASESSMNEKLEHKMQ